MEMLINSFLILLLLLFVHANTDKGIDSSLSMHQYNIRWSDVVGLHNVDDYGEEDKHGHDIEDRDALFMPWAPFWWKNNAIYNKKFSQKEVSFKLHMKEIIRYNLMIIRHYLFSLPLCVKS